MNPVASLFSWHDLSFTLALATGLAPALLQLLSGFGDGDSDAPDGGVDHDVDVDADVDADAGVEVGTHADGAGGADPDERAALLRVEGRLVLVPALAVQAVEQVMGAMKGAAAAQPVAS